MDSKFSVSKPKYFTLKKWILAIVIIVNIIFLMAALFWSEHMIKFAMGPSISANNRNQDDHNGDDDVEHVDHEHDNMNNEKKVNLYRILYEI